MELKWEAQCPNGYLAGSKILFFFFFLYVIEMSLKREKHNPGIHEVDTRNTYLEGKKEKKS
jgi:hypothetical protein